jgi:hypothetical protein
VSAPLTRALPLAVLLGLLFVACRCAERPAAVVQQDGPPPDELTIVRDAYDALPARGSLPVHERAALALEAAGAPYGYGARAAASMRRHKSEAWAGRVAMLVDHGGTDKLFAAWLDLLGSGTMAPRIPGDVKFLLRNGEARVNGDRNLERPEEVLRARYLAEVAWAMAVLDIAPADAGSP